MDIAGINANKPYPINDALYKRIKEEGIQLKYKETGKKADYSLTDNTGNTPCIHIPANCLQIQGWLEIQWDIAHELGHYLNWKDGQVSDNAIENERWAWNRGEEILKECEIPLVAQDGKWIISRNFYEEMGRCIGTYRIFRIMVEGKTSEKIKHIIKALFAFLVNELTMYCAIVGVLGMAINSEERTLLFNANTLNSLFWFIFILYICSFIIKKWLIFNRNES